MPFFASFGSGLEKCIRHQYYEEMSQKSEIVSLTHYNNIIIIQNIIWGIKFNGLVFHFTNFNLLWAYLYVLFTKNLLA